MVGRYATPEADITITHHLPPPEDDSTQDVSMSFVIPPQADASNLLDQDYDDFFSGPGLVTLSTPVLPRHLTNTRHSVRKVAGSIQTPAVVPSTILGQNLPSTELEPSVDKAELQETHIPPHPSPLLSPPTEPFTYTDPPTTASVVGTTSITGPGLSRPSDTLSESGRDAKICDGLKSLTAPSMASVLTTKATGTQPGIQSTSTSAPSRHSTNAQNTQIPRRPPIPAPQKKNKGPAQSRGTVIAESNQVTSKHRGGNVLYREKTPTQSRIGGGGAAKRLESTLSNRGAGSVESRIQSDPASSNSRSNVDRHANPTGNEHSDPGLLSDPAERYGAVTQRLVTTVLPPSGTIQSRFNLVSGGAGSSDSPSPSLGLPQGTEDHVEPKTTGQDIAEGERGGDDDRLTVSRLSPSKTVWECRYGSEDRIQPSPEPTPGTSIAVSPMRPSRKREASAGHESDTEPGCAWPDEWEKQCLIIESDREGEVRGGGAGKEDRRSERVEDWEKPRALLQPSRRENRVASGSLALTRRLKAKAARESPRVRKLRDKLAGRVVASRVGAGGRKPGIRGAQETSRGRHGALDVCRFPENVGASTTTSVAAVEGKGSDRTSSGEIPGPTMPYGGDNQRQGGAIDKDAGSIVGRPSFHPTLKRSTVPVEFRFELARRMGTTSRGTAAKEKSGPSAPRNNGREGGNKPSGHSRKRPKLDELGDAKSGAVDFEEPSSSRLREAKDDQCRDQTGSHASALKGSTCSRSNNSSATSIGRSKKRNPLIIPEAFRFSTEQRAKEREKFDEGVRVKQKEKERQSEEERAAKAVEEEREVKEMRKRAVPKANTIPGWYATVPKRKTA